MAAAAHFFHAVILLPTRSSPSFLPFPYPSCLSREDETAAASATSDDPPPRISSKATPQLTRWSRARAIRSGRRLDRTALRKKTSSPPSPSLLSEISLETDESDDESAAPPLADGKPIYMVSDGTGWTAEHSVNAALGQFDYCLVDRGCSVNTHLFSGSVKSLNPFFVPMFHTNSNSVNISHSKRQMIAASYFCVLLQSYIDSRSLKQGRELHLHIREAGLESNPVLLPKLLKLYSVCGQVEDMDKLIEIIKQAAKEGALVIYTLANPSMAESAKQACKLWGVPSMDILSPTIEAIASHIGVSPSGIPRGAPGRNPLTEDYFKRIEAIDFTIKQDDGALPQNLNHADIVLVGVSRTGKTPLSIYLAQKGYKVANVPIVMGVGLPKVLFEINEEKIFGLTINPLVLQTIRKARAKTLGFNSDMMSNYSDMEHVREELNFANKFFSENPVWPVIEVTGKAIEETAAVIVRIYHDRNKKYFLPRISKRY